MNLADMNATTRDAMHYKDYERLICQLASRAMPRVTALDPSMQMDDVVGFLNEVYLNCKARFDESRGLKFSTYFQNAAYFELNRMFERIGRERRVVAPISAQDLRSRTSLGEDDDCYVFLEDEMADSPEDICETRQEILRLARSLSPEARQVVTLLIAPTEALTAYQHNQPKAKDITVPTICKFLGFDKRTALRLRDEFKRLVGVDFNGLNGNRFA